VGETAARRPDRARDLGRLIDRRRSRIAAIGEARVSARPSRDDRRANFSVL
jgi:hypothetical protein